MKILVAYDQKISFASVMNKLIHRAKELDAYLYLVRACSADAKESEITRHENRLNELKNELFKLEGIKSETHVLIRGLTAGEEIVTFAREKGVDEIVIGLKKRSKVGKLLFGSTAQYVILESPCSVLIAK